MCDTFMTPFPLDPSYTTAQRHSHIDQSKAGRQYVRGVLLAALTLVLAGAPALGQNAAAISKVTPNRLPLPGASTETCNASDNPKHILPAGNQKTDLVISGNIWASVRHQW
jgi:hypothetical protein